MQSAHPHSLLRQPFKVNAEKLKLTQKRAKRRLTFGPEVR